MSFPCLCILRVNRTRFQFKYYQRAQILGSGMRLSPLGTSVTNWPIVQDPVWSNRWNENWHEKPKYSEKTYSSATLSTTLTPHDQTWARNRTAAVGSRRLTAWAVVRPSYTYYSAIYFQTNNNLTCLCCIISMFEDLIWVIFVAWCYTMMQSGKENPEIRMFTDAECSNKT
jgi:hypothetical protein